MLELWFAIAAGAVVLYAVLDGFDLGSGALHLSLARDTRERRQLMDAIGPWWDANEVWLLAVAGALFSAFPKALASALSGFYFPVFLVLWCLIGRGIAIEARHQLAHPLWVTFWDTIFMVSSLLLALFFGALVGNLVRGVPLDERGWFTIALFTDFRGTMPVGLLDAYTLATAAFGALVLAAHGAAFLALRCEGGIEARAAAWARRLAVATAIAWPLVTLATARVNGEMLRACITRPAGLIALAVALAGLVAAIVAKRRAVAFAGTSAFITGVLAATAAGLHPVLLRSVEDPARSLTSAAVAAAPATLRFAAIWWSIALPLVAFGFVLIARFHRERAPQ